MSEDFKVTGDLMKGKRGLVMGVANQHSIAWSISKALAGQGAELAFTYQTEALGKRVQPLAESISQGDTVIECDVTDEESIDQAFATLQAKWGKLDFIIHAIAFSDKDELKGQYLATTRDNFKTTMLVSCYSFTSVARRAADMMPDGGSLLTLTFIGSQRNMPSYNVMGVAKAGLEASVRYLAADLGPKNIRVNALSPGPMRTLAGAVINKSRQIFNGTALAAPLGRNATNQEVGSAGLYYCSDLSTGVTGTIHPIDGGFHATGLVLED